MELVELKGIILDVDYVNIDEKSTIRITLKQGGKAYTVFDPNFYPYFYLVPENRSLGKKTIEDLEISDENGRFSAYKVSECEMNLRGSDVRTLKVEFYSTRHLTKAREYMQEFGQCYEYDILFWKRYLIDKKISAVSGVAILAHEEGGRLMLDKISGVELVTNGVPKLNYLCFDIETYNPMGNPRVDKDPIIMISYTDGVEKRVVTTKKVNKGFVKTVKDEKALIEDFLETLKSKDIDLVVGYNSSNFDLPYIMERAKRLKINMDLGRYSEEARKEYHGLIDIFRIPGRANLDLYNVAKFVSVVGAAEQLIRVNRFRLVDIYQAITGNMKTMVDDKSAIWKIWDGADEGIEELAEYSLSDSVALKELYDFFMPLETEIARISGTTLSEAAVSTTGQLVEYLLMRYAYGNNELIMNKPDEREIGERLDNPIIGAYVKTPEAGVYDRIIAFDFRSLYPSIIIAHNIDPSTICRDCKDYYESPDGIRFRKAPVGIVPKVLRLLLKERAEVKKAYKKSPDDKFLGARSQALKILANSFYGYLGYARSRWYNRDCAGSVTAFGRDYIAKTIGEAEKEGFRVLYADTDSVFLLMGVKTKEDAVAFMKNVNSSLPETMELELDDVYVRGVFVGKKGGGAGAKKKYAMLSESGRIKIRGFELVRRDWSNVARETQRQVLETILKEGSKEKAVNIVKDVIKRLKDGDVKIKDLVIYTQLRKGIDSYDAKSPELSAVKKAIQKGVRKKEDMEGSMVGYVITKSGGSTSEKAEIEELAKDYDADYYITRQVLPATLKILKELGFSEEELKGGGAQKRLGM